MLDQPANHIIPGAAALSTPFSFMSYGGLLPPIPTRILSPIPTFCFPLVSSFFFFFFKQKTAYEIGQCWSSDVCSSDQIGRASCRGKSVDLGGRRIIKKKKK